MDCTAAQTVLVQAHLHLHLQRSVPAKCKLKPKRKPKKPKAPPIGYIHPCVWHRGWEFWSSQTQREKK